MLKNHKKLQAENLKSVEKPPKYSVQHLGGLAFYLLMLINGNTTTPAQKTQRRIGTKYNRVFFFDAKTTVFWRTQGKYQRAGTQKTRNTPETKMAHDKTHNYAWFQTA